MKITSVPEFASPIHVLIGPATVDSQTINRIVSIKYREWYRLGPHHIRLDKLNLIHRNPFAKIYLKKIPDEVESLKTWAADTGEGGQILLFTQSPYVVSRFEIEQVSYVRQVENNLELYRLSDCPRVEAGLSGGEFYIGELWWNLPDEEWLGLKTHPPNKMCRIPLDADSEM